MYVCIGPPKLLAVVFKEQEMSQQVVTRMQDLASEFLIIFRGGRLIPPDPHSGRGDPLPHPTPSPALAGRRAPGRPGVGAKRPGVGTQNLIPLNFSAVVAPLRGRSYFLALSYSVLCTTTGISCRVHLAAAADSTFLYVFKKCCSSSLLWPASSHTVSWCPFCCTVNWPFC